LQPEAFRERTGFDLDPANCHVFLCGNPAMIDDVEANLHTRGFVTRTPKQPEGNLHYERYW
jgi:ferredoxin--NADP+ reductase